MNEECDDIGFLLIFGFRKIKLRYTDGRCDDYFLKVCRGKIQLKFTYVVMIHLIF
jgi:hypothetical protein